MRFPPLSPLLLSSALAIAPVAPLQAQYGDSASRTPMMHDAPAAGMIHGADTHTATGTIHVVGAMPTQQIHFTSDFKTDATSELRAVLSSDMMAGAGSVDLGPVVQGDQLVAVPGSADARTFAHLLVVDSRSKTVVAATRIPGGTMDRKDAMMQGGMKRDSAKGKPR
jgi:hypothetical protein